MARPTIVGQLQIRLPAECQDAAPPLVFRSSCCPAGGEECHRWGLSARRSGWACSPTERRPAFASAAGRGDGQVKGTLKEKRFGNLLR